MTSRLVAPLAAPEAGLRGPRRSRVVWLLLAVLLLGGFLLRIWGLRTGLPRVYNRDEDVHFVLPAIQMFRDGWDTASYDQTNPAGLVYLLHYVFAVRFGGGSGATEAFASNPGSVVATARIVVALLATSSIALVFLAGRALLGHVAGLIAAAVLSVAFLSVSYGHLALNDAVAVAPVGLALLGAALALRHGRRRGYAIAGVGVGLAAATKYTAGIAVLPLLGALAVQLGTPVTRRAALRGAALAAVAGLAAFVIADPMALLHFGDFRSALSRQAEVTGGYAKLGVSQHSGFLYYLWTATWGLGWMPCLLALAGAGFLIKDDRRAAAVLVPAPIVFVVFMSSWERYFGRWLMPVFPMLCLLAGYGALRLGQLVLARRPDRIGRAVLAVGLVVLLAQGVVTSVHNDAALARDDTRGVLRDWMVAHIPAGSRIVIEPVVPKDWVRPIGSLERPEASIWKVGFRLEGPEYYEKALNPGLIDRYVTRGYCWVITGSTESGRAYAQPDLVPGAIAYYRELARRGKEAFRSSPYDAGAGPVDFNFDWAFDYYPLAYHRPGPEMTVYRLSGGRCGLAGDGSRT